MPFDRMDMLIVCRRRTYSCYCRAWRMTVGLPVNPCTMQTAPKPNYPHFCLLLLLYWPVFLCAQGSIGSWQSVGEGLNGRVNDLYIADGHVYAAGIFTDAGGHPDADYLARWNGETWQPVGTRLGDYVQVVRVYNQEVYIGGAFVNAGGNPDADHLARWDGSAWQAIGGGVNHTVNAIEFHQGELYIGGRFTDAGGDPEADHLARFDGTSWHSVGLGIVSFNFGLWALASDGQNLYAGGDFLSIGGIDSTQGIARWDGVHWNAVGRGFWGDMGVITLAVDGGNVYAGGDGGPVGQWMCGIALWDGTRWNGLGNGLSNCIYGEGAYEILPYQNGCFVGGVFNHTGIDNTGCIAQWDGEAWNALGEPGLLDDDLSTWLGVLALAADEDELYIGGNFPAVGGVPGTSNIARWDGLMVSTDQPRSEDDPLALILPNPAHDILQLPQGIANKVPLHIRITSISGQVAMDETCHTSAIDISALAPGMYVLEVISPSHHPSWKLIKQ